MLEHTMNFELYIENLGAIEKAEMTINPLTILAGENGTGKSFVTKLLYSVLNVLMQDIYRNELINVIDKLENNNEILKQFSNEKKVFNKDILNHISIFLGDFKGKISSATNTLQLDFHKETKKVNEIINEYNIELEKLLEMQTREKYEKENTESQTKKNSWENFIKFFAGLGLTIFAFQEYALLLEKLHNLIEEPQSNYVNIMGFYLTSEIKSNFQISNLKQLIKKDKENLIFEIKNLIKIEIQENKLNITQYDNTRTDIRNINRLVFFESPIYWRLSRDLIKNSHQPQTYYLSNEINDERLTGIPKHFLDLRELVFANFKHGERPKFIEQCADDLQKHLNGKFNTDSYDLSFETNQGQPIVKNLVSFGMTNLGIIQAVLSKNIINKGSFVFIDEPESNLHPEWQAVLADILVKLAENGVFVIITTHSSDMLKALDVISQEHKQHEDFTSVNYFEKGGILAELNQENISTVQQARLKLLETYDDLVLRGYLV